ncbi:MAG: energy transducer TonB [Alphaproteobacteria bacterium]
MAFGWASVAGAAPPKKADRDVPVDTGKPAFFVDWAASNTPPGLTSRPSRAKSDSLPVYPTDSVRKGEAGVTALTICITTDGRLVDIKLAHSSGFARLDEATIAWARTARFNPATINGDPVNVCGYALEYAWKLGA